MSDNEKKYSRTGRLARLHKAIVNHLTRTCETASRNRSIGLPTLSRLVANLNTVACKGFFILPFNSYFLWLLRITVICICVRGTRKGWSERSSDRRCKGMKGRGEKREKAGVKSEDADGWIDREADLEKRERLGG